MTTETAMRDAIGLAGLMLLAAPAAAQPVAVPGFGDLERWHAADTTDALARRRLAERIPAGASVAAARQGVTDANGRCKPEKREAGAWKCIIHQMTFASRGVDDIRWTIVLHGSDGRITSVDASRYVDTHWTN